MKNQQRGRANSFSSGHLMATSTFLSVILLAAVLLSVVYKASFSHRFDRFDSVAQDPILTPTPTPATPTPTATPITSNQFYVGPNGSPNGSGSIEQPWDLQTALAHPAAVKPGDTIWLRGGVYTKAWTTSDMYNSKLTGTTQAPITVRQYPGERAIIDGGSSPSYKDHHALRIRGAYTWYWGFEVMFSDLSRRSTLSDNTDLHRGRGVTINGNHIKCINLIVHDAAIGFSFWTPGENSEIYGCLVFYNGWEQVGEGGGGHGLYVHNENGTKRITDSIIFKQFRNGIQIYNDDASSHIDNIVVEGNIAFENGALSTEGYARNILYGGHGLAYNPVIKHNYTYYNPAVRTGIAQNNLGYSAGSDGAIVANNYFVTEGIALKVVASTNLTMENNMFYDSVSGFSASDYPLNTYLKTRPSGVVTFVRPNSYERGRGHIAVYNWSNQSTVSVDISGVGLQAGEAYEVIDVQDYFGSPVLNGTYDGTAINLPLTSTTVTQPIGNDLPLAVTHTPREFGAFLVRKR